MDEDYQLKSHLAAGGYPTFAVLDDEYRWRLTRQQSNDLGVAWNDEIWPIVSELLMR